ncbi:hypothetical protein M441DRAFT_72884 [Trichoderma asperellum CBS 433.97]|uniref:Uncharacterized protein n=1 Tax=Trichoderma asperellum (strain ATCC 204424 / CBS 433.97 / NBRC 101777) TaxID=1042311 RepID=A0A2T3YW72_TRIA4|nr:hypothetical protein M441DRAFT_72884 [Trichoderma asperellum CBS 433.97]PTB36813.1 hypothetical protein M441DRAFT_72884 [Trichoderma asperellum CBS 433.97]
MPWAPTTAQGDLLFVAVGRSSLRLRDPASESHSHLATPLEPRDWDLDAIPAPSLGSPLLAFSAVGTDALPCPLQNVFLPPPLPATLSAVLRPMKCMQPAYDSQHSSGRSILVSTPVMARSLPQAGLAQPRGGVSTKYLLPTWFCQPRTGSSSAVGTETHTMPFYLVLHAPHSSAASPRLVMEPGS